MAASTSTSCSICFNAVRSITLIGLVSITTPATEGSLAAMDASGRALK